MIIFGFGEFGASVFSCINIYVCTTCLSLNVNGLVFPSFQMRRGTIVTTIFIGSTISTPRISNHPPSIKDFFGYSHPYNQHSSFCLGRKTRFISSNQTSCWMFVQKDHWRQAFNLTLLIDAFVTKGLVKLPEDALGDQNWKSSRHIFRSINL